MDGLGRRCFAEAIGTFVLVFVGTASVVVNDSFQDVLSHLGISLAWGLVVMTMIYSIGDVSGAHINPAVSVGFFVARRMPGRELLPYIGSQCAGAIAASFLVRAIYASHPNLGATLPSGTLMQSLAMEIMLTFVLMFVVLGVSTGAKEKGIMAGAAVGATVGMCAMIGGPISGASMNPARSLGPAVASGNLIELWVYIVGPVIGAGLAVLSCRLVRGEGCCTSCDVSEAA